MSDHVGNRGGGGLTLVLRRYRDADISVENVDGRLLNVLIVVDAHFALVTWSERVASVDFYFSFSQFGKLKSGNLGPQQLLDLLGL